MDLDDCRCPPGALPLRQAMEAWLPETVLAEVRAAGDELNRNARRVYWIDEQGRRNFEIDADSDFNRPLLMRMKEAQDAAGSAFLALLRAGRLVAWAREGSPVAPLRRVPADAWASLRLAHVTEGRARGHGVNLFGIQVAPAAEPAERPADWPAPAPAAAPPPMVPAGAWWTAEQAVSWLAFGLPLRWEDARKAAGAAEDNGERMARAQRQLSDAIAARSLPAWGQETADIAKPPLRDTLAPIPPEDFAGPSALTVQMNGWAFPPKLLRRYEGRWWQGIMFEAAAVERAFQGSGDCQAPEPANEPAATPSTPEPVGQPAPVYSLSGLRAWYRLRVGTWPASHPPPSEADDIAAAAAHFRRDIPRDPFRGIRRELAPEAWKKPGPRNKPA